MGCRVGGLGGKTAREALRVEAGSAVRTPLKILACGPACATAAQAAAARGPPRFSRSGRSHSHPALRKRQYMTLQTAAMTPSASG